MAHLHKRIFAAVLLCLALSFTLFYSQKKPQMVAVSSEQLFASLPEEEIFFYYDELMEHIPESERYAGQGIYLQIGPKLVFFDWEYTTDIYSPMELKLMNNEQHLAIIFNDNAGTGLHFSHIHIIDLETFEEIPV